MTNDDDVTFEEALEPTDFGLIVCGKTGRLKGLWMPKENDDMPVPENIVALCVDYFGIDEKEFEENSDDDDIDLSNVTLH